MLGNELAHQREELETSFSKDPADSTESIE